MTSSSLFVLLHLALFSLEDSLAFVSPKGRPRGRRLVVHSSSTTTSSRWSNNNNAAADSSSSRRRLEEKEESTETCSSTSSSSIMFDGPLWLTKERDACGVGFIANAAASTTAEDDDDDDEEYFGTHDVLQSGLAALSCMEHRGACGGDGQSGDGAGIMTEIPWKLFTAYRSTGCPRPGVGQVFLPRDENRRAAVQEMIQDVCEQNELHFLGWRKVPVDESVLGDLAAASCPAMWQFFVKAPARLSADDDTERDGFERTLYLVRRRFDVERRQRGLVWEDDDDCVYVSSFSSRTIVYKGMVKSAVLSAFYKDLTDPAYTTRFCIYHRRFSTNTNPRWPLAQPMRVIGHNGEINTLQGNCNWIRAREAAKDRCSESPVPVVCDVGDLVDVNSTENIVTMCNTQDVPSVLEPVVDADRSDSANLDSVFELMTQSRHRAPCALMALVPAAYEQNAEYVREYPEIADFYSFHGGLLEAWDGPALLVYSDGKTVGASLDRNGLRPARYSVTADGTVYLQSETGVIPNLKEADIVQKGRLGPGQMINVDLVTGEFKDNLHIKSEIAKRHPYGEWIARQRRDVSRGDFSADRIFDSDDDNTYAQAVAGWSLEDIGMQIDDMAGAAKETTYSMGDDAPLAVLSERPHPVYNYFKQRFAQVTNPPIDPLREGIVMSLQTTLGKKESIYKVSEAGARLLVLDTPVLNEAMMEQIAKHADTELGGFQQSTLSTRYPVEDGVAGIERAIDRLCEDAVEHVRDDKTEVLILSDWAVSRQVLEETTYIPPLLAVGAVHHRLIEEGLRMETGLIVETASAWSTHHFACLVGYGANAVHPYLAFETVRQWHGFDKTQKRMKAGKLKRTTVQQAQENYRTAVENGLLKILSKMGISLLSSYQGAQIFEALGLSEQVIQRSFVGTTSRIGGMSLQDLAAETIQMRPEAASAKMKLLNNGFYKPVPKLGEYHINSSDMTKLLHKAIGLDKTVSDATGRGDMPNNGVKPVSVADYEIFKASLETGPVANLRDVLDFQSDRPSIPIDDVEPVESIMKRFCTGAMSLGALSREAHETLAVAVNRIGGKSNSGEGGEDPVRARTITDVDAETGRSPTFPHLAGLRTGDSANSYIHQVASGRFGVTPEFLVTAGQIEIKMAQGAKPGEGGQLPGTKVSEYIASLRASKPGVTLISPPPHHDIYSIEDLAQLIHDLHAVNEKAGVSVKLVSSIGIGTVACGVAKAAADVIQISGNDGGTGASPLSSIKHAGGPWELGLAESHAALLRNDLRHRVVLRVDGGMRTGRDVAVAAALGAEEYGFGTVAMIAEGCVMARVCHLNTCPVGVTSQKEELRRKFPGTPDHVVAFFTLVAEEVRQLLSHLGYSKLQDLIGRADLLIESESQKARISKTTGVNLLPFFSGVPNTADDRSFLTATVEEGTGGQQQQRVPKEEVVHVNGDSSDLDRQLAFHPDIQKVIHDNDGEAAVSFDIRNTDRSTGAMLAGTIAREHGNAGFRGTVTVQLRGSAGQSFGAFCLPGVRLRLAGEANDYVGKGMHGGEIVVVPTAAAGFVAADSSIVGNACLYGATGGDFHANGRAGERFAVRNSGAYAVAEGAGDHCCEYMTGGVVVMLGTVGRNVGAGMTGGLGYFYDNDDDDASDDNSTAAPAASSAASASSSSFFNKLNHEIVKVQRVGTAEGEAQLRHMIERHYELTGSERADDILSNWDVEKNKFWQVYPPSEATTVLVKKGQVSSSTTAADDDNDDDAIATATAAEDDDDTDIPTLRVSASAPDGEVCFLPVGGVMSPEQTQRCAD